jgi:hypothetical protein
MLCRTTPPPPSTPSTPGTPLQLCFQSSFAFLRSRVLVGAVLVVSIIGMVITSGVNQDRVCRTVVRDAAG